MEILLALTLMSAYFCIMGIIPVVINRISGETWENSFKLARINEFESRD